MRKYILIHIIVLLLATTAYAGNLVFTSGFGGDNSNGAVVQYDLDQNKITTPISLAGNPLSGRNLQQDQWVLAKGGNGLTTGSDGYIYGVDENAALAPSLANVLDLSSVANATGIIYRFHPDNYKVEVLHAFTGSTPIFSPGYPVNSLDFDLRAPRFGLFEASPGVFYGMAVRGGVNDLGGVYKYTVSTGEYKKIGDFDSVGTLGWEPTSPLFLGPGNEVYGTLRKNNESNDRGYLFRVDSATDTLAYVDNLDASGPIGDDPVGRMVYNSSNNSIYGCNEYSLYNVNIPPTPVGGGAVFIYNFNTGDATNQVSIASGQVDDLGSRLVGLVKGGNANYYAVTKAKGAHGFGTLLLFASNSLTRLHDFSHAPDGNSLQADGTKIYGTYENPVWHGYNMWSYDFTTGTFEELMPVGTQYGGDIQPAFAVNGDKIITRTLYDPGMNVGYIVELDRATGQSTTVSQAHSPDGSLAVGELLDLGNGVYLGYTQTDGASDPQHQNTWGTILKYNLRNSTVTKLASLRDIYPTTRTPATYKASAMIRASNGKVYFIVNAYSYPGIYGHYLVELDPDTGQFIHSLLINNTRNFYGLPGLIEYEPGKLAMMTLGTLHLYDIGSGDFDKGTETQPLSFDTATYGLAYGNLIKASDGLLYGFTRRDGTLGSDKATLFSLDPAGWGITFYDLPGGVSEANIGLAEYNGKLYGSTKSGGANDHGYIFSFDLTTPAITIEYSLNADTDGAIFGAGWLVQEDKLYSTSYVGGANGFGTLVEFDPATQQLKVLENLTVNNGYSWRGTPIYMEDIEDIEELPFPWPMFIPAITGSGRQ